MSKTKLKLPAITADVINKTSQDLNYIKFDNGMLIYFGNFSNTYAGSHQPTSFIRDLDIPFKDTNYSVFITPQQNVGNFTYLAPFASGKRVSSFKYGAYNNADTSVTITMSVVAVGFWK